MTNSGLGARKVQEDPGISCARKHGSSQTPREPFQKIRLSLAIKNNRKRIKHILSIKWLHESIVTVKEGGKKVGEALLS